MEKEQKVCTVAIAGLGNRGLDTYAQCALRFPEKMRLVAVADPRPERVALAKAQFRLEDSQCFDSFEAMMAAPRQAEVLFLCTQDRQHVPQAIQAMEQGYHILMEKPISPELRDCREILAAAQRTGRRVVVCHVLRYTPFYNKLKQILDGGVIGDVVCVQHMENVQYWHQAHSFVRGNWRNSAQTSPMILQKCCHDFDLLLWLTGKHCQSVSSYGGTYLFKEAMAPAGAAKRCLDGCGAKDRCPYDAEKIYITNPGTGVAAGCQGWPCNVLCSDPTEEKIRQAIQSGPYGRCVYHCDNDVVDHQVVNMEMTDGTSMQLTMCAFTARGGRETKLMGTLGEIQADLSSQIIRVMVYGKEAYEVDVNTLATNFSGHAGGDERMVEEFLDVISGACPPTVRHTALEDSVESHLMALAAEESRIRGGVPVRLEEME